MLKSLQKIELDSSYMFISMDEDRNKASIFLQISKFLNQDF